MLWPLKTNDVWNETQERISTDCGKKKWGGRIRKSEMALFAVSQSNQYVVVGGKKQKSNRNTLSWRKSNQFPCRAGQAKQLTVNVHIAGPRWVVTLNVSPNKQQKAFKRLTPKSQRTSYERGVYRRVSFKFPRKRPQARTNDLCESGTPAGENPVCPQQFPQPVWCHLALLSWWYCHPYMLKGDKRQTWVCFV